jgi:hypothetical protein
MFFCKGTPRTGFQIPFKINRAFFIREGKGRFDLPRAKLGGVRNLTGIVFFQTDV